MDDARSGVVAGATAYVLWGVLTLYWHELRGLDAFGLISWRIVWSVAVLAVALLVTRRWRALLGVASDRGLALRVVVAAFMLTCNWTTYVWCVTHGRVIETALGYFLSPIGLVAAGVVAYHERLRASQRVALALAVVAVVVLTIGYGAPPVFALVLATTWTVYGVLKKTVPLGVLESLMAECLVVAPFAVVFLVLHPSLQGASTLQRALVPCTGLVTTVPLLLFAYAAPRVPLATLGWLQYSVPTINLLLGVFLYDEAMPTWRLVGFALVWIGLAVMAVDTVRRGRRDTARRALLNSA